jgi:selenocysteine-specific elongation factor
MTILDKDALEPGESGFATIRLAEPIATLPGQRFIARGFEASERAGRTIAGGVVLDPGPGRRRRKTDATIDVMQKLEALVREGPEGDRLEAALIALVGETRVHGIVIADLAIRLGYPRGKVETVAKKAKAITVIGDRAVADGELAALGGRIVETVASFHAEYPFRKAIAVAEIATRLDPDLSADIVARAAQRLVSEKRLAAEPEGVRAPSHRPRAEADPVAKQKLLAALEAKGIEPPSPAELEAACGVTGSTFKELLAALARSGDIVSASPTIHFAKSAWDGATSKVLAHIAREGEISTATAKELLGISRKFLIPMLEAMDKHRLTVRVGEVRKARR